MSRNRFDDGVSDILGAVVLVIVIVMGISLISVVILSNPTPQKIPAISADITRINNQTIYIRHEGGDTMQRAEMIIQVDGIDSTSAFSRIGSDWSSFSVGDVLVYNIPAGNPVPSSIQLVYTGGASAQIVASLGVPAPVGGGATPTASGTPTPTASPTPVPALPVNAGFSASPVFGTAPLTVQFTDASIGPVTNWSWTFGEGNTSQDQNPVHQYAAPGTYTVSQTVSNGTGSDTMTRPGYITVNLYSPGIIANYYSDQGWSVPAATNVANRIRFADASSGAASDVTNWPVAYIGKDDHFSVKFDGLLKVDTEADYTFYLTSDDGSYLSLDGVQVIDNGGDHATQERTATVHLLPGFHAISMKMYENAGGAVAWLEYSMPSMPRKFIDQFYHTPSIPPSVDFTATPRVGTVPLTVQFTDISSDATGWTWDFGDAMPVSHAQSPAHTYTTAGSYTVSLVATNAVGTNTAIKNNYIAVGALTGGFTASYYTGQTWTTLAGTRTDPRIRFADPAGVSAGYASDESGWPLSIVGRQDDFSVNWDGYLHVSADDTYTFYLTSDDGSWLWVDDASVIDNSGLHGPLMVSGTAHLTPGYHHIQVRMFENGGSAVAHLEYSSPSVGARQFVTDVWHA
ncbi:MAG: PA14 domain-containing protein [Methanoregula sp.]